MILKERNIPVNIPYHKALQHRSLPEDINRKKIEEQLLKMWAGYHGECKLDRQISTIDNDDLIILNDLCIPIGKTFFQIDSLILSRYLALILEVKHIAGPLDLGGEFDQMSRTINGEVVGFSNPFAQAKRYKIHLFQWMKINKLPLLPIDFLVVFTNTSSVLSSMNNSSDYTAKIIKVDSFVSEFLSIQQNYSIPHQTAKELTNTSHLLIKHHTQYIPPPIEKEIISGVQCTLCMSFSMIRHRFSWLCPACGNNDRNAHKQAIYDFLLLKGPTINNMKAREFLGIESQKTTHRILNTMNLVIQGKGKGTTYSLPNNFNEGYNQ
ncbi:nuclease-related domain-containing protein [Rossellomorea arthrocnemi]